MPLRCADTANEWSTSSATARTGAVAQVRGAAGDPAVTTWGRPASRPCARGKPAVLDVITSGPTGAILINLLQRPGEPSVHAARCLPGLHAHRHGQTWCWGPTWTRRSSRPCRQAEWPSSMRLIEQGRCARAPETPRARAGSNPAARAAIAVAVSEVNKGIRQFQRDGTSASCGPHARAQEVVAGHHVVLALLGCWCTSPGLRGGAFIYTLF